MSSVLPIRQTESLISLRRNRRLFQQNRPIRDIGLISSLSGFFLIKALFEFFKYRHIEPPKLIIRAVITAWWLSAWFRNRALQ
jgi:hypothetical protein